MLNFLSNRLLIIGANIMKKIIPLFLLVVFSSSIFAKDSEFKGYVSCNYEKEFDAQNRSVYYVTPCKKTLFFDKDGRKNLSAYDLSKSANYAFHKLLENEVRILVVKKEADILLGMDPANCNISRSYSECTEDRREGRDDYVESSKEYQQDDSDFSYQIKTLPHIVDSNYGVIIQE